MEALCRVLRIVVLAVGMLPPTASFISASDDIGLLAPFISTYCPAGWVGTQGGEGNAVGEYRDYIFQDTYPVLYERAGAFGLAAAQTWGGGYRWYRLPDFRGFFPRVRDPGPIRDTEYRVIGSTQADTFQGHYHYTANVVSPGGYIRASAEGSANGAGYPTGNAVANSTNGTPRTSSETRPKNIAFLFCIKATSDTFVSGGTSITMVPSTFTLVAISTQVAADLNPGIWGYFTAGDLSFWTGVLFAIVVIVGFKAGGMR